MEKSFLDDYLEDFVLLSSRTHHVPDFGGLSVLGGVPPAAQTTR